VQALLDKATEIARGRGHRRVSKAHLLAALFSEPTALYQTEHWKSVDVGGMIEHLLDLEGADSLATYRDAAPPTIDPELDKQLKKLKPFFGEPRAIDLFEALVADLDVESFAWDDAPIRAFYDRVLVEARGSSIVAIDHALVVLTREDERFRTAVRKVGGDPDTVIESVRARIESGIRSWAISSYAALRVRASVYANLHRWRALDLQPIVIAILQSAGAVVSLEVAGVSRDDLLFSYVHPEAAFEVDEKPGPAEVVLHNDDVTTQDAVVYALERYFEKTHAEATKLMWSVHEKGSASFRVHSGIAAAKAVRAVRKEHPTLWIEVRM
jgi:ATP-dependent Clp protease adapter protein ClpS